MLPAATATKSIFKAAILAAFLCAALPASAHVVASPDTAKSGAWFRTALRVGHGCNGSDITAITVNVPDDVLIIKPQVKQGWKISIKKETLATPVKGPHGMISEVTRSITWTGDLPDAYFDEFGLSMKLPDTKGDLIFPVLQQCKKGSIFWKDAPAKGAHSHKGHHDTPAPVIHLE